MENNDLVGWIGWEDRDGMHVAKKEDVETTVLPSRKIQIKKKRIDRNA